MAKRYRIIIGTSKEGVKALALPATEKDTPWRLEGSIREFGEFTTDRSTGLDIRNIRHEQSGFFGVYSKEE